MLSGEPLIRVERVSKSYPGVQALCEVDFELATGEVCALLGKNGAGKSTLVKILSGATTPDQGQIYWQGNPTTLPTPAHALTTGIATVYQEMSLVPALTVAENILLGRWPRQKRLGFQLIDQQAVMEKAGRAIEPMGIPLDLGKKVRDLSISQRQLVEIAKALSFQPKLLILDEPTSALTQAEVDQLLTLVRRLAANGVAVLYVSHRLQEIPRVADTLCILRDGRRMGTIPVEEASPERIAVMMIGNDWTRMEKDVRRGDTRVCLSVRDLTHRRLGLQHISLDLHVGEVLGLAGLLGSGRTELLRVLFGLEPMESGEIILNGEPIFQPDPELMVRKGVGFTPEDRKSDGLVLLLDLEDNLTMSCPGRISRYQMISRRTRKALAQEMTEMLEIAAPGLHTPAGSLSGGNQQKLIMGKWLNSQVRVLLLDEPTRGVDIDTKEQIYRIIRRLADQGLSVIFVSSEMEEVLSVSDRILVMNQGRIVGSSPAGQAELEHVMALAMQEKAP